MRLEMTFFEATKNRLRRALPPEKKIGGVDSKPLFFKMNLKKWTDGENKIEIGR